MPTDVIFIKCRTSEFTEIPVRFITVFRKSNTPVTKHISIDMKKLMDRHVDYLFFNFAISKLYACTSINRHAVLIVLIICSWVKSSRAALFVLKMRLIIPLILINDTVSIQL